MEIQIQSFRKKFYSRKMVQEWILENESELGSNLEWFDSRDPNENAEVTDKNGNKVVVVVEKLEVKQFYLDSV